MLPAANRGAGQSIGFPDVCNTVVGPATVPIPYPNIGMNAQALGFSPVVKVSMVNALNMGSKIAMTSGDEAGAAHPTIKGAGSYTMGSPIVSIDKLPAITLTCPTTGNNMNNPLGASLVPSAVNVMMCRAVREDDAGGLAEEIAETLARTSVADVRWAGDQIGWISIPVCSGDLAGSVLDAALGLEGRGARVVVLDLRGNAGGDLDAARELASALLPEGAIVVQLVEADGEVTIHRARGGARCLLPLVVVVDRGTASAAELLAAALQENARAIVVGEGTFGKGWAWTMTTSPEGVAVARCAARWLTPGGSSIEGRGVQPDLAICGGEAGVGEDAASIAATALAGELLAGP